MYLRSECEWNTGYMVQSFGSSTFQLSPTFSRTLTGPYHLSESFLEGLSIFQLRVSISTKSPTFQSTGRRRLSVNLFIFSCCTRRDDCANSITSFIRCATLVASFRFSFSVAVFDDSGFCKSHEVRGSVLLRSWNGVMLLNDS